MHLIGVSKITLHSSAFHLFKLKHHLFQSFWQTSNYSLRNGRQDNSSHLPRIFQVSKYLKFSGKTTIHYLSQDFQDGNFTIFLVSSNRYHSDSHQNVFLPSLNLPFQFKNKIINLPLT